MLRYSELLIITSLYFPLSRARAASSLVSRRFKRRRQGDGSALKAGSATLLQRKASVHHFLQFIWLEEVIRFAPIVPARVVLIVGAHHIGRRWCNYETTRILVHPWHVFVHNARRPKLLELPVSRMDQAPGPELFRVVLHVDQQACLPEVVARDAVLIHPVDLFKRQRFDRLRRRERQVGLGRERLVVVLGHGRRDARPEAEHAPSL